MKSIRPPGSRQFATRSSVSGTEATARVMTPATVRGNFGPTLPAKTSTFSSPSRSQAVAQELGAGPAGLGQDHLDVRPGDLQRDARQARARSPCRSAARAARRTSGPAGCRHSASAPCSRSCGCASGSARRWPRGAAGDRPRAGRAARPSARARNAARWSCSDVRPGTFMNRVTRNLAMINCSRCDRTAGRAGRTAGWPTGGRPSPRA